MKKIYSCPDGYPSCRKAEATGEFCANKCEAEGKMTDTNTKEAEAEAEAAFAEWFEGLLITALDKEFPLEDIHSEEIFVNGYLAATKNLEAEVAELKKDAERYRWIKENITEELTPNSLKGEFAVEHKTVYKLPYLMAWADFCGQINFDEAIDIKIKPE